jgi:hypothetical protein
MLFVIAKRGFNFGLNGCTKLFMTKASIYDNQVVLWTTGRQLEKPGKLGILGAIFQLPGRSQAPILYGARAAYLPLNYQLITQGG